MEELNGTVDSFFDRNKLYLKTARDHEMNNSVRSKSNRDLDQNMNMMPMPPQNSARSRIMNSNTLDSVDLASIDNQIVNKQEYQWYRHRDIGAKTRHMLTFHEPEAVRLDFDKSVWLTSFPLDMASIQMIYISAKLKSELSKSIRKVSSRTRANWFALDTTTNMLNLLLLCSSKSYFWYSHFNLSFKFNYSYSLYYNI